MYLQISITAGFSAAKSISWPCLRPQAVPIGTAQWAWAACSAGVSWDFAASAGLPVVRQIEDAKRTLGAKGEGLKYIACFQSYTGTYCDLARLERIYTEAASQPNIVGLSIATRPDSLGPEGEFRQDALRLYG